MSKLDYITVRGFKSIASIEELKPGPLTVLIGPNGSGKTNFVGVFSFLSALREGRLHILSGPLSMKSTQHPCGKPASACRT